MNDSHRQHLSVSGFYVDEPAALQGQSAGAGLPGQHQQTNNYHRGITEEEDHPFM